eukprot:scaffold11678_cov58-Phaeocystis_antarctica.AAC.4
MRGRVNGLVESSTVGFRNATGRGTCHHMRLAGIKILPLKKTFRARARGARAGAGTRLGTDVTEAIHRACSSFFLDSTFSHTALTPHARHTAPGPSRSSSWPVEQRLLQWYLELGHCVGRLGARSVAPDEPSGADLLAGDDVDAVVHAHVAALGDLGPRLGGGARLRGVPLERVVLAVLLVRVRGEELARARGDVHDGDGARAVDHEQRDVVLGQLVPVEHADVGRGGDDLVREPRVLALRLAELERGVVVEEDEGGDAVRQAGHDRARVDEHLVVEAALVAVLRVHRALHHVLELRGRQRRDEVGRAARDERAHVVLPRAEHLRLGGREDDAARRERVELGRVDDARRPPLLEPAAPRVEEAAVGLPLVVARHPRRGVVLRAVEAVDRQPGLAQVVARLAALEELAQVSARQAGDALGHAAAAARDLAVLLGPVDPRVRTLRGGAVRRHDDVFGLLRPATVGLLDLTHAALADGHVVLVGKLGLARVRVDRRRVGDAAVEPCAAAVQALV